MTWMRRLFKRKLKTESVFNLAKAKVATLIKEQNKGVPNIDPLKQSAKPSKEFINSLLSSGVHNYEILHQTQTLIIVKLSYNKSGVLLKHTHYGYYELLFIKNGRFRSETGDEISKGEWILIDGDIPHSYMAVEDNSVLVSVFTKDKAKCNITTLEKSTSIKR